MIAWDLFHHRLPAEGLHNIFIEFFLFIRGLLLNKGVDRKINIPVRGGGGVNKYGEIFRSTTVIW